MENLIQEQAIQIQLLLEINESQAQQIAKLKKLNAELTFQIKELRRLIHGSKSEKFKASFLSSTDANAPKLPFGEPLSDAVQIEQQIQTITLNRTKRTAANPPLRNLLPDHLDRVQNVIEPDNIPGGALRIGEQITEQLEYQPGKLFVTQTVRPKYSPKDKSSVIIADMPIPKCIAGASLLMRILEDKYVDHLPLYRQQQRFKRDGMYIPASTLSG